MYVNYSPLLLSHNVLNWKVFSDYGKFFTINKFLMMP